MNSQEPSQELLQASERELLVMLVQEVQKIRQLLEIGYALSMSEKRSGAWGAEYSGWIHRSK